MVRKIGTNKRTGTDRTTKTTSRTAITNSGIGTRIIVRTDRIRINRPELSSRFYGLLLLKE